MERMHRIEKAVTSIFGSHINTDHALEDKKEVDNNVQKMLKLIGADQNGHSSERSELVDLVNDFHKHYETLFGQYDHMIGKVKRNINSNKSHHGKLSFVLTSDSDSDSDEKSSNSHQGKVGSEFSTDEYRNLQNQLEITKTRNDELEDQVASLVRKLEGCEILMDKLSEKETMVERMEQDLHTVRDEVNTLQAKNQNLLGEIEESLQAFSDMNEKLRAIKEENESLLSEKSDLLNRVLEGEECLRGARTEIERMEDEISVLRPEKESLKEEVVKALEQLSELHQQLADAGNEIKVLSSEKLEYSSKLDELGRAHRSLEEAMESLYSKNSSLLSNYENLKNNFEAVSEQKDVLLQKVVILEGENGALPIRVQEAEDTILELRIDIGLLRDQNSNLTETLNTQSLEHDYLVSDYRNIVEKLRVTEEENEILSAQIERSTDQNSRFLVDYEDMEKELEAVKQELSEVKNILEATVDERCSLSSEKLNLLDKIQELELIVEDVRNDRDKLGGDHLELEGELGVVKKELFRQNSSISEKSSPSEKVQWAGMIVEELQNERRKLSGENFELQRELEAVKHELFELRNILEATRYQHSSLTSENSTLLGKIQESELIIEELIKDRETFGGDNVKLQREMEATKRELFELKTTLEAAREEHGSLTSEKLNLLDKIQELELSLEEVRNDREKLSGDHLEFQKEMDALKQEFSVHKSILEATRDQHNSLMSEKTDLLGKLKGLEMILEEVRNEREKLSGDNLELQKELEAAKNEIDGYKSIVEDTQDRHNNLISENSALLGKIEEANLMLEELGKEKERLDGCNLELERDLEAVKKELIESKNIIEATGVEHSSEKLNLLDKIRELNLILEKASIEREKIGEHLHLENELGSANKELKAQKTELEEQIKIINLASSELEFSLKTLEDELKGRISTLEAKLQDQIGIYNELLETHKQLEYERADMEREVVKLSSQVQTLEVQLRLSNQKLKITETESKEKEDSYKQTVGSLLEARRIFEDRMLASSKKAIILENDLKRMKESVRVKVAALEDVGEKIEENVDTRFGLTLKKVLACVAEVHALRKLVAGLVREKKAMKVKLSSHEALISKLKGESEKKVAELERKMREKEDEVVATSEEKREAIRQLCLLIDYHRENYDRLMQQVSTSSKK